MEYKSLNNLLKIRPDTFETTLRVNKFDKPEELDQAVKSLKEWVVKQPHFSRTDFSDAYYRSSIFEGKGSVEKAKQIIDRMCTLRTLLPQYFHTTAFNIRKDFQGVFDVTYPVILPNVTKNHQRVFVSKLRTNVTDTNQITHYFKYGYLFGEYLKVCDFVVDYRVIVDLTDINLMDLLTKLNPMDLRHAFTIYLEGYGMKIKGIHLITTSKFIDGLVTILKQILKQKIGDRIYVHKSSEELFDIVGTDVLPEDLGGQEKSLKSIHEDWLNELSRDEFMEYVLKMNSATTDESRRPSTKFNEEYAGMPGTFRLLNLD